jgi:hypothetical protein
MNTNHGKGPVAEPSDQDLKKHGDALEQQVNDAAGKQAQGKGDDDKDKDALDALNP